MPSVVKISKMSELCLIWPLSCNLTFSILDNQFLYKESNKIYFVPLSTYELNLAHLEFSLIHWSLKMFLFFLLQVSAALHLITALNKQKENLTNVLLVNCKMCELYLGKFILVMLSCLNHLNIFLYIYTL